MYKINTVIIRTEIINNSKGFTTLLGFGITFAVLNNRMNGDINNSIIKLKTFFGLTFIINNSYSIDFLSKYLDNQANHFYYLFAS